MSPHLPAAIRRPVIVVLATTTLIAGVTLLAVHPDGPRPRGAAAGSAVTPVDALAGGRAHWQARTAADPDAALTDLRTELARAERQGSPQARWLRMAWLVCATAARDTGAAGSLLARAEAEVPQALAAGDTLAAFELSLAVESTAVQHLGQAPDPARLQLLQRLAADLADPLYDGLVAQLRGVIAHQAGHTGDAQFHFEQALGLLTHRFDRVEVQTQLALALAEDGSAAAAPLASAHLDDVVRALPPEQYAGRLTAALHLSQLLGSAGRTAEALELADRALQVARRRGQPVELALAHAARAQTLLIAGDASAALADLDAAAVDRLPPADALAALAGRAVALAQLRDPQARAAVTLARSRGTAATGASAPARARFHEMLAAASQALGDPGAALQDLQTAAGLRQSLAAVLQSSLADARRESLAQTTQAATAAERRAGWWAGLALMMMLLAGALWLHRHAHRQHRAAADRLQAQDATHHQLLALNHTHAHQLEAICQALRRPARALALLMRSDGVAASGADVQRQHMQAVRDCSEAFGDTVEALLDMLRLQDGSHVPHPERFDLARLLQELGRTYEPLARRKGLQWDLQAQTCGVFTDRHLLRRIVANLLDSLLRSTDHGHLRVQVQPLAGQQALEITSTGLDAIAGLNASEASAADELGMGPATARLACDLLGHRLTVTSALGGGVTIRIELPPALPPAESPQPSRPAPAGRSVALVEDDAFSRITLMNALVDAGLEVQAYASFAELMTPAAGSAGAVPGVLISDLHLGDHGDATEALRALRRRPEWRDVPVLMLTGDIRDEVNLLATELGVALAYKPISVRRLLERIALLRSPQPLPATPSPTTDATTPRSAVRAGPEPSPATAPAHTAEIHA